MSLLRLERPKTQLLFFILPQHKVDHTVAVIANSVKQNNRVRACVHLAKVPISSFKAVVKLYLQIMNPGSIPAEWLPHYTRSDYEQWKGEWELINGLPYAMSPSPNFKHQKLGSRFVFLLMEQLQQLDASCNCQVIYELDWVINDFTIVRPDVMIICDVIPDDFLRTPPVFILEIFSPATRLKDRNLKFRLYEEHGVKYYFMADPEKNSLEGFVLKNNRFEEYHLSSFQLTSSCFFELDLGKLWQ